LSSSRNAMSSTQCRPFSTTQWLRPASAMGTVGIGQAGV
jgi:hypothetical protein